MPAWVFLALLSPLLVAAAAGAAWVLVRSEAGGVVRWAAELLSVLGHQLEGVAGDAAPLDVVPRRGLSAWLARLPHRMLGCAGCTSWWVGVGLTVVGGAALRVGVGSLLLLVVPVAAASAGLGALLDAAWLTLVMQGEWVREQREHAAQVTAAMGHLHTDSSVVPAPPGVLPLQTVVRGAADAIVGEEAGGVPLRDPAASPDTTHDFPHPDLAPDDGDPLPVVPAHKVARLHPSMPVPQPPVTNGSPA